MHNKTDRTTDTSTVQLLPCPFCGGKARIIRDKFGTVEVGAVECSNCTASSVIFSKLGGSEKESIEAWNTRKPMERIVERLEEEIRNYETRFTYYDAGWNNGINKAIEIVKDELN